MSLVFECLEAAGVNLSKPLPPTSFSNVRKERIKGGGMRYFITDQNGREISLLKRFEYATRSFDWDLLADIDTIAEYRDQGLASRLIQSAYEDSAKKNKGVYVFVRDTNNIATQLYKSLGFDFVREYDLEDGHYLVMAKGNADRTQLERMNFR